MSLASLRPRSVTQTVDAAVAFYRANFAAVVTIAMLVAAPPTILKAIAPVSLERLIAAVGNLLVPIAQGAIVLIVARAVERDEVLDVSPALRETSERAGSLVAVQMVTGLLVIFGLILLIVPGLIALAWTAVCVPVVMIEQVGYARALERARTLARGRWGHVFGTLLLSWVIALLPLFGLAATLGALGTSDRVSDLVGELLFAVLFPIPTISIALLYYDLRLRTEDADLDAMIVALPARG